MKVSKSTICEALDLREQARREVLNHLERASETQRELTKLDEFLAENLNLFQL